MSPASFIAARERLKMNRSEFARELGISRTTLRGYEEGKYPIPRTVALAVSAVLNGFPPAT